MEYLRKKIFLLEKKEVILTGRTASKVTSRRKESLLFETKPLNPNDTSGKRWVRLDELYEIHNSQAPPRYEDLVAAVKKAVDKGKITND